MLDAGWYENAIAFSQRTLLTTGGENSGAAGDKEDLLGPFVHVR